MMKHLSVVAVLYLAARVNGQVSTAVVTVTGSAPTPEATSSQYTSDSTFQSSILDAHNFYRAQHNASDLSWNDTSADFAQDWSDECNFRHSGGPTGENLAAGYANASASVDAWGLEREEYNFNSPGFSEETGHFTQLVWGNTTSVGCARSSCQGDNGTPGWYVVCEYYPPGNIVGQDNEYFEWNVLPQVEGSDTDTVESGTSTETSSSSAVKFEVVGVLRLLAGVAGLAVGTEILQLW
ncbi:SCP-like extracellular protein [Phlyctema vagabunda]|uniref:SCP-like extracellular protein n=1 Tax=Phlyctema vagabunda TaxID=108571 RepID=A0ABR4P405_9HELO